MASAFYCEDLTCPICLTIFTDPVTLLCGHSFCRGCITCVQQCPQCRTAVPIEGTCLPTSYILKELAEKAKAAEEIKKEPDSDKAEAAELCPDHEEKLKLFCVTDQQLACIICRDGERHQGHKFKPIKEAAASLRQELEKGMENLCGDILATESLANTQREEITKTRAKSQQLITQIRRQFEEMHQFLRKREDEIKTELKLKEEDAVEKMSKSFNAIDTALSESRELEGKLTSVLKIKDSERFLKSWTESNSRMTVEDLLRARANDLQVVNTSLSLGPYESHLQFFVWKEMLQVIQPRAEQLSLKSNSTSITVSTDGRSLFCTPKRDQAQSGFSSNFSSTTDSHQTTSSLFGSTTRSDQATSSLFGSTTRSDQARTFGLGNNKPFGKASSLSFGQPPAFGSRPSGQTTGSGFAFGSTGFGQPPPYNVIHTNPEQTKDKFFLSSLSTTHALSVNEFTSGQHYWEIEVGHRDFWKLGIKDHFLKYDGEKYSTCSPNKTTDSDSKELVFKDRPRKIGIYLNCTSKKLSFYDADNMTHIHSVSSSLMSMPVSAYFNIKATAPDLNPLTVCWY